MSQIVESTGMVGVDFGAERKENVWREGQPRTFTVSGGAGALGYFLRDLQQKSKLDVPKSIALPSLQKAKGQSV
jgi:hypothetical protein